MATITGRTCNLCSEKITGGLEGLIAHGEADHPDYYLSGAGPNGETKGRTLEFVEKNYWCPLDEKWYASRKYLARTIKQFGLTNEEYFLRYGRDHMPKEWEELTRDDKFGDAASKSPCLQCGRDTKFNEGKWAYPVFCTSSCSTKWHAENTDRVERAQATLKERQAIDPTLQLRPNQTAYWMVRGHSEEEAIELVRHRQKAGSLERLQAKHGEELGAIIFNEGLTRRKEAINKSDMFKGGSKVSKELFDAVSEITGLDLLYGDRETSVYTISKKYIWVDCLNRDSKRVIEFFGEFWHASPTKYSADDIIFESKGISACDIWEKDRVRLNTLRESGFEVLVIWEDDYRANPEWAIAEAVAFLQKPK